MIRGNKSSDVSEAAHECALKAFEIKFDKDKENFVRGVNNENISYFLNKSNVKYIAIKY